MNKPLATLGLIATIVIASATPADQKAIRASYAALDAALASKSVAKLKAIAHPECVWVQKGSKQEFRAKDVFANLETAFKSAKSMKHVTTIKSIKVNGSEATVVSSSTLTVVASDPSKKSKTSTFVSKDASISKWVKSGAKWVVKRVERDTTAMSIDGNAVQMGASR